MRFFLMALTAGGLVSCSSSTSKTGVDPEPAGADKVTISEGNNPFAFSQKDIQQGDDGRITGGKRSQFELKSEAAYARANATAHLQRSYQKQDWVGVRDYSTGSYQTESYGDSERKSWFGGRKSRDADQVANLGGRDYSTGSYRTGQAAESGQVRATGSSAYVDEQARDGWRRIPILENKEYRSLTLGQAKSLLGR
jgi:hypothetical protein